MAMAQASASDEIPFFIDFNMLHIFNKKRISFILRYQKQFCVTFMEINVRICSEQIRFSY